MPLSVEPHADYSGRIAAARERLGLDIADVADQSAIGFDVLSALETDANAVCMSISLRELGELCRVLNVRPAELLADALSGPTAALSPQELVSAIRHYLEEHRMTPAAFSEHAGWDVEPALADGTRALDWNVDGLFDVCQVLELNWLHALPP